MIELRLGQTRLRAHPLSLLIPLLALRLGLGGEVAAMAVGLALHESAHLAAARAMGVRVRQLDLTPFGGAAALDNPYALSPAQLFATSAAGPLANLALIVGTAALAHWSVLPPFMALTVLRANLLLMLFNLLPALPLDGGRMLFALLSWPVGRRRALSIGIWGGRAVAAFLVAGALWIFIAFRRVNLSMLFAAVYILASLPEESRAFLDARAMSMLRADHLRDGPVELGMWAVDAATPVSDALRGLRADSGTLFAVCREGTILGYVDESRLLNAAIEDPSTQVSHLLRPSFAKAV